MDLPPNQLLGHQQTPPAHKPPPAEEDEEDEDDDDSVPRQLLPLSLPNGALKKLHRTAPHHPLSRRTGRERPRTNHLVYGECMKNHAASLGGHALDGCGEFMPSPGSTQTEPTSLTCAACGCHRNFHRRLLQTLEAQEAGGAEEEEEDGDGEDYGFLQNLRPPVGFNRYGSSAPHMLMALGTGVHGGAAPSSPPLVGAGAAVGAAPACAGPFGSALPAKRSRTKFTPEQKTSMQLLCERLGWRMQKRDEALVEQRCREIGVSRGVFKVWMHNNKHAFVGGPSSRRGGGGGGGAGGVLIGSFQLGAGGHPHPPPGGDAAAVAAGDGGRVNGDSGNNFGDSTAAHAVVNSSSVSS